MVKTGRGGRREGAGRKRLQVGAKPLSAGLADKLLADATTEMRWRELRDGDEPWLRLAVEKYIWDRAEGKPVQFVGGAEDKPVNINVRIHRIGAKP